MSARFLAGSNGMWWCERRLDFPLPEVHNAGAVADRSSRTEKLPREDGAKCLTQRRNRVVESMSTGGVLRPGTLSVVIRSLTRKFLQLNSMRYFSHW